MAKNKHAEVDEEHLAKIATANEHGWRAGYLEGRAHAIALVVGSVGWVPWLVETINELYRRFGNEDVDRHINDALRTRGLPGMASTAAAPRLAAPAEADDDIPAAPDEADDDIPSFDDD